MPGNLTALGWFGDEGGGNAAVHAGASSPDPRHRRVQRPRPKGPPRMSPVGSATGDAAASAAATSQCALLGSLEESLLTGRMGGMAPSSVCGFRCELGASGMGKTTAHVALPLDAAFYRIPGEPAPSPYVGAASLAGLPGGRYKVPRRGQVQLAVCNPERTGIKLFLVPYDLAAMPPRHGTFLRQRTYEVGRDGRRRLLYAVHLRFASGAKGRVYLRHEIRVAFAHRAPDRPEQTETITEGPTPTFSPVS